MVNVGDEKAISGSDGTRSHISLKRYKLSMEDKMAAGTFGDR